MSSIVRLHQVRVGADGEDRLWEAWQARTTPKKVTVRVKGRKKTRWVYKSRSFAFRKHGGEDAAFDAAWTWLYGRKGKA